MISGKIASPGLFSGGCFIKYLFNGKKRKSPQGLSLMNNKNKLIILLLVFNLLIIGTVSASGLYNDSATVVGQDTAKSSGVQYALLVGLSTYQDPSNNLEGVQYDVPHMRDMLINDCGYSASRITTLQDSQATKSAIRSALLQMSSRAGKDDTFVFYFSGHGYVYPSYSGTSYIEPYDSRGGFLKLRHFKFRTETMAGWDPVPGMFS